METGPLNFVTLSRRDFNNQRVKPDENLYFVHEKYVDDKGEVKTKIVLYKGKIPIGLVDKGRDGLSVFRTALSLGDERVVVDQSDIMTDGRALQVGDMFIDGSTDNWLYQVTATPGTQAHAERIAPVRGDKGDKGDTGLTPEIAVSASVDDAVGTPSVEVAKGGTAENPTFGFAFKNLKGNKGDTGDTGLTPEIAVSATVDDAVGTPAVEVTKSGTTENPTFGFAFHNLKGNKGDKGDTGPQGPQGIPGPIGTTPNIKVNATLDAFPLSNPTVNVIQGGTTEEPTITFEFIGVKGEKGDTGDPTALYAGNVLSPQSQTFYAYPGRYGIKDFNYSTIPVTADFSYASGGAHIGEQTSHLLLEQGDVLNIQYDKNKVTPYLTSSARNQIGKSIEDEIGLFVFSWVSRYVIIDYKGANKYIQPS